MKTKKLNYVTRLFKSKALQSVLQPRYRRLQKVANFSKIVILGFLLVGCASGPTKKYTEMTSASFDAKVLMRDKVAGKSGIVNVQFKGVKDQKIRLDVLSPIQTHLASLTLNGEELSYILVPDKKAYRGLASGAAMVPVIRVPLNPKLLYNIFFDQPITEKNWTCTKDKDDFLKECKSKDMKITWVSREGAKRTLEIEHPKAFLQINIHKYGGEVSPTDPKFTLKIPDAFKLL